MPRVTTTPQPPTNPAPPQPEVPVPVIATTQTVQTQTSAPVESKLESVMQRTRVEIAPQPLTDIPCYYLNDRHGWPEFKRALNECGLVWNLADWMTTIVYKGHEWQQIAKGGVDLEEYFPSIEKTAAGDGHHSKTSSLGSKLVGLLNLPKNMGDYVKPNVQFCCLNTVEFEDDRKLPARQKLWNWIVRSLRGNRSVTGPYHYLVDEVQMYDISYLFKRLVEVLEQITICSLDDELECVIKMDFKPEKQNIFAYLGDLRKAIKRLHDVNERIPEGGRILLPDTYVRSRLIRAARQVPVYKPVLDALLIQPVAVWSKLTSDQLYHQLEAVCANEQAVSSQATFASSSTPIMDSLTANVAQTQSKEKQREKKDTCYNFSKGKCNRNNCRFVHSAQPEQNVSEKKTNPQPQAKCQKCGGDHKSKDCKLTDPCAWCKKLGHLEALCRSKKANQPRALQANVDGSQIYAHMLKVDIPSNACAMNISIPPAPPDTVCEKFMADTGANRSIHPNGRAAANFYRMRLDISTASTGNSMRSEGVGRMLLYTPEGHQFPGFDNVIFAKQSAEKLASVGELCNAGMVCVFDKHGLTTYKEQDFKVSGSIFTRDERDKRTQMYPLTLYRKVGEKNISVPPIISSFALQEKKKEFQSECIQELPMYVGDGDALPAALLAKSYIKDGMSEIERLHAKCGDVGIKYLKRAFPGLKTPKKYRCEFCIEGKIHKFGHGPCRAGERTEYPPGVCIHSDHSGPYAKSTGGARYSQLFMDRGSGYLWGFRMSKKTGHYLVAPKVFVDSQALSGRKVQIFHSDGDGVFSSQETKELLLNEKIRQEFSAPYDSNTNPFIERARRTIFEGVCTALLRSGAPASFWGEAEAHKIFTINNLPTVPDKEKENVFLSRRNLLEGNTRPFNLERLMAFGTATTCYVPLQRRQGGKEPAQRRSFKGALLGYVENMPAYRVWDLEAKTIRSVSYNFTICHEGYYPFRDKKLWPPDCLDDPYAFSPIVDGVLSTIEWKKFKFDEEETKEIFLVAPTLIMDPPVPTPIIPEPATPVEVAPPADAPVVEEKIPEKNPEPSSSRLKSFWQTALEKPSEKKTSTNFTNVSQQILPVPTNPYDKPISISPPATIREARLCPWWPQYKEACDAEYQGHVDAGTWELVARPNGKNILRGKWVFSDQRGEDGKISKFKARFVAIGSSQKYGVDYEETFAGVMVAKSFRIMLSILNEDPTHEMEHWDIKMAFTQAFLEDEIYMYQPEGYEVAGQETKICRLKKSLYGLKQSARNWQLLLRKYFHQNHYFTTHADPCVYFLNVEGAWCMCSTHVDDIFCLYNEKGKKLRDTLFSSIESGVPIKNLGPVSWALKTIILRDRTNGILKISQEQFTQDYNSKSTADPRVASTRSPATTPNFPENYPEDERLDRVDETLKKQYQSDIGVFWWLAQISRPDIYYAVHRCAKLISKPNLRLGRRIQKIKNYLIETPSIGLIFQRNRDAPTLSGYVDASFSAEEQRIGYFYLFRGNLVSWVSENPTRVMTSSTEVECRGLVQFGKENAWHRQLQAELNLFKVDEPTIVYEDNTASISLAHNQSTPHKKSKHFGLEWAYFKEAVEFEEIRPIFVSTDLQPADMLTKSILSSKFAEFRDMVMGDETLQTHFAAKTMITHSFVCLK